MPLANRVVCSLLFREEPVGLFTCNTCSREYRSSNGFTNLMNHLRRFHGDYEAQAEAMLREQNPLQLRLVDQRTTDLFRWIEWIVVDKLPFSFCERHLARQNARMGSVSENTLVSYISKIHDRVESAIRGLLPESFGIVLDGWTNGGRHYVAIFAVFAIPGSRTDSHSTRADDYFDDIDCHTRRYVLLAFSPLDEEEDLSAQSIFDLISDTLSHYEKPWESVLFMVGDNCSVNQYIGRREGAIPMIGCASHRFNLAVQDFLAPDEPLLARVHALMRRLSTVKARAMLRKISPLAPVLRNVTRWSSSYAMVKRYCELEPCLRSLDHGTIAEYDLDVYLLGRRENERVYALCKDMEAMESVTKTLQKTSLTMSAVRRLFDRVVQTYPVLENRLSSTAAIVNHPELESGIVKLQRNEGLTSSERAACASFRLADQVSSTVAETSENYSIVRDAFKRRKGVRRQRYQDVLYVPPTSNECERFFSAAKLVLTDLRKRMEPATLEMVMSLSYNRDLWDIYTVESIRLELGQNGRN